MVNEDHFQELFTLTPSTTKNTTPVSVYTGDMDDMIMSRYKPSYPQNHCDRVAYHPWLASTGTMVGERNVSWPGS